MVAIALFATLLQQGAKSVDQAFQDIFKTTGNSIPDSPWSVTHSNGISQFTHGSNMVWIEESTCNLKLFSLAQSPRDKPRLSNFSKAEASKIAIQFHKSLKLGGSKFTYLPPSKDTSQIEQLKSGYEGCYAFQFSEEPLGIRALSNGNFCTIVVDGETGKIITVQSETSRRYFGSRPKVMVSHVEDLKSQGLKPIPELKFTLSWMAACSTPTYSKKFPGINLDRDVVLVESSSIGLRFFWYEPGTNNRLHPIALVGSQ